MKVCISGIDIDPDSPTITLLGRAPTNQGRDVPTVSATPVLSSAVLPTTVTAPMIETSQEDTYAG